MLSVKLDVMKWIWYDLVGYFWVWELLKIFLYKLAVIASLLYATSAFKSFHKNALLLGSGGNLCHD